MMAGRMCGIQPHAGREMAERRNIGEILMSFGRITEEDVTEAVAYQKEHGGYFGEALLSLGLISQEELEWGLASQFDLPYVFPDADSIDPRAASLVTPEWALAHLALPIMMTEQALTVVVDSPVKTRAIQDLQARTDREIELALASPSRIRGLIRQVYARDRPDEEAGRSAPVKLQEVFSRALDAGALRFGVSVRGQRAWAWYEDGGRVRRHRLHGLWDSELQALVAPPPEEALEERASRGDWSARINRDGVVHPVAVRYLGDESGAEYLFRPVRDDTVVEERFDPPSRETLSEVRLLARSGAARFLVTSEPQDLGGEILPHLSTLLLDSSWRSVHVSDGVRPPPPESFSLELPRDDPESWRGELEGLKAFHFDAVAVDLSGPADRWIESALDIADVAFLLWEGNRDRKVAHEAGVRWELRVETIDEDRLRWTLDPLQG